MRSLTILIACFNEETYIKQCLLSLQAQDCDDFEVIISDNASKDSTVEKVLEAIHGDDRFRLHTQSENIGAVKNGEFLLDQVKSEFVMYLGAHDYLSEGYVRECLTAIQQDSHISISIAPAIPVDEEGEGFSSNWLKIYDFAQANPAIRYLNSVAQLGDGTPFQGIMRTALLRQVDTPPIASFDLILISNMLWHGFLHYSHGENYFRRYFKNRKSSYMERITGSSESKIDRRPFFEAYLKNFDSLFKGDATLHKQIRSKILEVLCRRFQDDGGVAAAEMMPELFQKSSLDPLENQNVISQNTAKMKPQSGVADNIKQIGGASRPFVFFLSPRANYRSTIISENEVFCGPDCEDEIEDGQRKTIKTPPGAFDLPKFLSGLGLDQDPELILVKADATGRNFPRNLGRFKCPKVLLVGVTHFLAQPIQKLVEYARNEPFDFIIMDVTRHHARWFQEAGFKNVHWLPALEYNPHILDVSRKSKYPLTFVGQAGSHHPFRKYILDKLKAEGLPLQTLQASQKDAAKIYNESLITLNITLNADVNMRFFEVPAAGGFMLADRLAKPSGLYELFTPGEDFDDWGSFDELKEKIKFYISHPKIAHQIRTSGQAKLLKNHSPQIKRQEFWDLILRGVENPVYKLTDSKRMISFGGLKSGMKCLPAYEFFQEMHRKSVSLNFYGAEEDLSELRELVDLPRVEVFTHNKVDALPNRSLSNPSDNLPVQSILALNSRLQPEELEKLLLNFKGDFILAPTELYKALAAWGFAEIVDGVLECCKPKFRELQCALKSDSEAAINIAGECIKICSNEFESLAVAEAALALKKHDIQREALFQAVEFNRDCVAALVSLAELSLESDLKVDAAILLNEADRIVGLPPEVKTLRDQLLEHVAASPDVQDYLNSLAGGAFSPPPRTLRFLVVTNLFPPQELGGYGRKLWEFSAGLLKRGHEIEILTSDADYLAKEADQSELVLEPYVQRSMLLTGEWRDGKTNLIGNASEQARRVHQNALIVSKAAKRFKPDVVLLGNLDFMGLLLLEKLLENKIPVLHSLGNQTPGYSQAESIKSPLYALAPCSDWLGAFVLKQGYSVPCMRTVYPGARIDRFYRFFLPDVRKLRITYASLLMPYKGGQILIQALVHLHGMGVDFEAEIAGDTTDQSFVDALVKIISAAGMSQKVRFIGYQGRKALSSLFARSNVLVFPSQFDEPFGITQVEAMASGLVVITSGKGGTKEIVQHEKNGLIFEAGNSVSLASNLARVAGDINLARTLQENARKRSVELSVMASVVRIESMAEDLISIKNCKFPANRLKSPDGQNFTQLDLSAEGGISDFLSTAYMRFGEGRLTDAEDICREILSKDERCGGAWHLMGKMAALQGDLETGGEFLSVACDLDSQNAEFIRDLADFFLRKKELDLAEQHARRALELLPDSPEGLVLLGRILAENDDKPAALVAFQEAIRIRKDYAEGLSYYALALQKFGRGKDAISQIRKACAIEPESVEFQTNLAILLEQNARYVDALAAYGKAARMNPDVGFVWFRQGKLLNGLKRYAESVTTLEKAIALPGQLGDYHYEYGLALHMSKRFQEALVHYEKALSMGYNTSALQCNRGVIYKDLRRGGDAILAFHTAVKMEPTNVSYLNNLGAAALEIGLNSEALECFEQAVEKNPKLPTAHNNIGNLLKDRARGMDALPHYRTSIELNPDDRDAPSNYLLCHMYIPDMDPKIVFEEHKKWGLATTKKFPQAFKFKPREAGSKIRVGFLSADLCHHPVAHFIEPIFREYDRERFEFVAYGDQRKSDDFSARFAKQVDLWRETSSYDDRALAKLIHEDRVDILFELAGHTAYNRLGVFALKPAPVQISYLGYPGTTGLPTIDFRITDPFVDPLGKTEHLHTEKLIRLPECAWCFEPDAFAPEVEPLPALKNGYVTFGCFNNMAKLNAGLFETWAEILLRVPGSHLRLKARTLTDEGVRKELMAYFTGRGIDESRLDFFGHTKKIVDHLSHYHSVDIALDSFPYHGTTTTCEAMWMGCPVVTRAGKVHVSRVGVSLLNAVHLQEFIAETQEDYIEKAVELASDLDKIASLRSELRKKMKSSVLMDGKSFVRGFEAALTDILPKPRG